MKNSVEGSLPITGYEGKQEEVEEIKWDTRKKGKGIKRREQQRIMCKV